MIFQDFCAVLSRIEATTLRLEMTRLLSDLFKQLDKDEIEPACWLLLGRLAPLYENVEFNFAEKMLMRALSLCVVGKVQTSQAGESQLGLLVEDQSDTALQFVHKQFKMYGDLGIVTERVLEELENRKDDRRLIDVYASLKQLALENGEGSQDRKIQHAVSLLRKSTPQTGRYISRIMLGTLRLGFSDMTLLDALSWAKTGNKSLRKTLELAYQVKADIGKLAHTILVEGEDGLKNFEIELGVPIAPALCQRLDTADEMVEKMGTMIVEPKYDGTRVLIHFKKHGKDWRVRTFTRNLEESSGMFPELVKALESLDVKEIILDSEAVGYDPETNKMLSFQLTIQRKRKHDVAETATRIPLRFFVFDVLYIDGTSLVHKPLDERKKLLATIFENASQTFVISPFIVTENADELRTYHAKQLALGLEGVVMKQLYSEYQPGRRGFSWVKFKEEEGTLGKLADTIDCVVMGYYKGQGKRTGFGIGAFLVGVYDTKADVFKTIAKIGTGLSDDQWRDMKNRCEALKSDGAPRTYIVSDALTPDVWVRSSLVVEIAADEITNSPNHSAELALRFPRLIKCRDDKKPEQATSLVELRKMVGK